MFQKENSLTCDMICKSFRKWFGDKVVDKPLRVSTVSSNGNTMITLRGQNTKLATWLVNSGAGSGSSDKGVPEFIFRCDRRTQAYFLRGLFDIRDFTFRSFDGFFLGEFEKRLCV